MSQFRILLAEDNREHQHLLLLALANAQPKIDVCLVKTGQDMLEMVQNQHFDCLILDFNLPDYTAVELLKACSSILHETPVIVISSSSEQQVVVDSLRSSVADFISKMDAIEGDALWQRVRGAIVKTQASRNERRQTERRIRELAEDSETDPLTGLRNRRHFESIMKDGRLRNDRRRVVSCFMIDIDHFKAINDQYGHTAGDQVLQAIASTIRGALVSSDTAIRWGGEEFLLLRPSVSETESWIWAEKLRQQVEANPVRVNDQEISITLSIGTVTAPTRMISEETIEAADQALCLAKEQGRNRIVTMTMVRVYEAVQAVEKINHTSPYDKRDQFVTICKEFLGPTQLEHLTNHCEAVGETARKLGKLLNLDEDAQERAYSAGLFHDIGKCLIPEELLNKPFALTDDEWLLMNQHASVGAELGARLGLADDIVQAVRQYRHRFDEEADTENSDAIQSVLARIISVADALTSMTSDRPYSSAQTPGDALSILREERGKQFDPDVVDAAHYIDGEKPRLRLAA